MSISRKSRCGAEVRVAPRRRVVLVDWIVFEQAPSSRPRLNDGAASESRGWGNPLRAAVRAQTQRRARFHIAVRVVVHAPQHRANARAVPADVLACERRDVRGYRTAGGRSALVGRSRQRDPSAGETPRVTRDRLGRAVRPRTAAHTHALSAATMPIPLAEPHRVVTKISRR